MVKATDDITLLSWTRVVSISEGQDPLGLNLRVSARLASQLLHCITSITRRARYYSFIPWAISVARRMDHGTLLRDRLRYVEKAFAISCVIHHEGAPCNGGSLVGSESLVQWFTGNRKALINVDKLPFAKNPAFSLYLASLVNLHLIESEQPMEEVNEEELIRISINPELTLTPLGQKIADGYGVAVAKADPASILLEPKPLSADALRKWGVAGGLCELTENSSEMEFLRDLMFNRVGLTETSHCFRRNSLLLMLHLVNIAAKHQLPLTEWEFGDAVYFKNITDDDEPPKIAAVTWPPPLDDIASRWRMFYFHMYLTVVLENLFVCVVGEANVKRLEGFRLPDLLDPLKSASFNRKLRSLLGVNYQGDFLALVPKNLFAVAGLDIEHFNAKYSKVLDDIISIKHPLSERTLQILLADPDRHGTPEAIALSAVLFSVVCLRYLHLEETPQGGWLAKCVGDDPFENVTVPVVVHDLRNHFPDPWQLTFGELLRFLLERHVVRLHLSLAYSKTGPFICEDIERIRGRGLRYDSPSYNNGRFSRAMRILEDLKLMETDPETKLIRRTKEGSQVLKDELAKGETP